MRELKEKSGSIKDDIKDLKEGQGRLENAQEEIKTMIGELYPKNANRHLELKNSIDELRRDL